MSNIQYPISNKRVALVLGSGGARGLAHIGAIEALEERGYTITSIAGCSMGSIIAGMYAAGELPKAKEWFLRVDKQLILRMLDINLLSVNSLVKGQRIILELQKVVPDRPIEQLKIPCSLVASDIIHTDEVVFRSGSLFEAVRASISIPLFFQPVQIGKRLLIDGGILNPLPLHVVERTEGDILVAMDISGKDSMHIEDALPEPIDVEGKLAEINAKGWTVPNSVEKQLRQLGKRVDANVCAGPPTWARTSVLPRCWTACLICRFSRTPCCRFVSPHPMYMLSCASTRIILLILIKRNRSSRTANES